eukprot:CAMPEP_0184966462 /NCGR_PEP_ID=MMETSP1098-20130426/123_1 /TAXON_ID=89044 /ORGANISM="Spumella elongata, Strain CCAP 955/1" /LENGTH=207 /DNA_ID=CAMNT_0027487735 /DNA_START=16 /DNA_END=639 /DNA_ORIENTATION=+
MTEVASPDVFLGKRRSSIDDCEMSEDNVPSSNRRYKVSRPNRVTMDAVVDTDEQGFHKRIRSNGYGESDATTPAGGLSASASEQIQRYHESVVSSIRMEHQMALGRKDQEIAHLTNENRNMSGQCLAMIQEHNACLEENRLLKKAVAIQDGRCRELSANYDKMQNVMALAAQHIAQLEQKNEELTSQLNQMMFSSNCSFPPRPPDVY